MPSNFKKLVRERMAKTGESWATAARFVRQAGDKKPMGCPFCALTVQQVVAMPDGDAEKLYLKGDPSTWCQDHTLIALELRRRRFYGKPLVLQMVETFERLKTEDESLPVNEDEQGEGDVELPPFDGRLMSYEDAKRWADLLEVQGAFEASDGKMSMRVWADGHEATAHGTDFIVTQVEAWSALRRKMEAK